MKKIFYFLSASTLIVACNTAPKVADTAPAQANVVAAPDTAGLAEYQQWKAQNELANATAYMKATQAATVEPEISRPVKKTYVAPKKSSTKSRSTSHSSAPVANIRNNNTSVANTDNGSAVSESANTAKVEEKKGISKAAKGTAIGAAGGAVLGAVIAKNNRVLGGVIGGVIGGGVGYGIGRGMDKKDGRY